MNYYWTYFLLPSAGVASARAPRRATLPQDRTGSSPGLLMIGALFVLVRTRSGPGPAAIAVSLAVLAASAEGALQDRRSVRRGRPLAVLARHEHRCGQQLVIRRTPHRQHPAIAVVHPPAHDLGRARPRRPPYASSPAPRRVRRDRRSGARPRPRDDDESAPGRGLFAPVRIVRGADARRSRAGGAPPGTRWRRSLRARRRVGHGGPGDGRGRAALDLGFSGFSPHRSRPDTAAVARTGPGAGDGRTLARPIASARPSRRRSGIAAGLLPAVPRQDLGSLVGRLSRRPDSRFDPGPARSTLERLPARSRCAAGAAILVAGLPTTVIDTYNAQDIGNRRPGPASGGHCRRHPRSSRRRLAFFFFFFF